MSFKCSVICKQKVYTRSEVISKIRSFQSLFKLEQNCVFLFVISLSVPEIFKFPIMQI